MCENKIVIFGVGKKGRETSIVLQKLFSNLEVIFIDNNSKENLIDGKKVYSACDFLKKPSSKKYIYIVRGIYSEEMKAQVLDAGVSYKKIYSLERYIAQYYNIPFVMPKISKKTYDEVLIFDCSAGFAMGGVEKWSYMLARELKKKKKKILFYTNSIEQQPPEEFKEDVLYLPLKKDLSNFDEQLEHIALALNKYSKITFIAAHISSFISIAVQLKNCLDANIKIISVIHSSLSYVKEENIAIRDKLDKIICVNSVIYEELVSDETLGCKVYYKETPIFLCEFDREYTLNKLYPIHIGYAARLEIEHKRADLLCTLLDELERHQCNYYLEIAGDGKCYTMIEQYIYKNQLEKRVNLLGRLDYAQMNSFWKRHDVAINLSETEGCSLSMLESMSVGTPNIITHTIGSEDFVKDGENGFLIPIGDMCSMANKICELEKDRNLIPKMGKNSYDVIKRKCNINAYIDFFEQQILS